MPAEVVTQIMMTQITTTATTIFRRLGDRFRP